MSDNFVLAAGVIAVTGLILVVIVALVLRATAHRIGAAIHSALSVFGDTAQARLIGIGLTALIIPGFVTAPLDAVTRAINAFLSKSPSIYGPVVEAISKHFKEEQVAQAIMLGFNSLLQACSNALAALIPPVIPLILGLALWAFFGQALSEGRHAKLLQYRHTLRTIRPAVWKNFLLFTVLLGGAYLSIAAITSIPSLQQGETPIENDKTRLTQLLNASRLHATKETFDKDFKLPDDIKPFESIRELLKVAPVEDSVQPVLPPKPVPQTAPPSASQGTTSSSPDTANTGLPKTLRPPQTSSTASPVPPDQAKALADQLSRLSATDMNLQSQVDMAKNWLAQEEQSRTQLRATVMQVKDTTFANEESALQKTADSFDNGTAGRMAERERSRFIRALNDAYQTYVTNQENQLRTCIADITWRETDWQSRARFLVQNFSYQVNGILKYGSAYTYPAFNPILLGAPPEVLNCGMDQTGYQLPTPPNAVDDWGVFRFFAGWLLQSQSLALASITGMLGAGLFGAATSTFIRQRKTRTKGDPLVDDMAGVIIRGFSAAIVIFLAVQGGLNVFSTATGDPNPYVLLCTCLVGAVFSEDVWAKAQTWLQKGDTQNGAGRGQDGKTTKEQPPEGTRGDLES